MGQTQSQNSATRVNACVPYVQKGFFSPLYNRCLLFSLDVSCKLQLVWQDMQWRICLIPEHRLDAPSNILPAPYPQPWRYISALFSAAASLQSTPNPHCKLPFSLLFHLDPNLHVWGVFSFPSLLNAPWKWRQARLFIRKIAGQALLTTGCLFGEFICQTQAVLPRIT